MNYWLSFGASAVSGLNPTFIQFRTTAGGTLAPPSISEPGSFGLYMFSYDALTQVAFIASGVTTGLSFNDRFIQGVFDPSDNFGFTLSAIAATQSAFAPVVVPGYSATIANQSLIIQNYSLGIQSYSSIVGAYSLGVANFSLGIQGASLLGDTASSFGTDSVDPTSVFGFLKRAQETREGNETYIKATGIMDTYSRGSSVLLIEKTISDNLTETTKT